MFDSMSIVTKVLMGVTALGFAATVVSAIKDHRDNAECCCEDTCSDCELIDPVAET